MAQRIDLTGEQRVRVARLVEAGALLAQAVRITGFPRGAVTRYVSGQADLAWKAARNANPTSAQARKRSRALDDDLAALAVVDDSFIDPVRCADMWGAVLEVQINTARGWAVADRCHYTAQARERLKDEARGWLLGGDCAAICALVGIEHSLLVREFQRGFPAMYRLEGPRVRTREGRANRQFAVAAE